MRAFFAALVVLAPLFALPAHAEAGPILTDPQGDVVAQGFAADQATPTLPGPSGVLGSDSADLLSLDVAETADALGLTLTVASLAGQSTGATYFVGFTWGGVPYRIVVDYYVFMDQSFQRAVLQSQADDGWSDVAPLAFTPDAGAGKLSFEMQKAALLDATRRSPNKGDALQDLRVASDRTQRLGFLVANAGAGYADVMPDGGKGVPFVFALGDEATGSLLLVAPQRVRVSNGGATTFVYRAEVRNLGDADDDVRLEITDLPPEWNGTVQSPVRVPAHSNKTVAVLASIPFAHQHGGFDAFTLVATSPRDAGSRATLRMGVLHTPIPQPTGHHPELFLHAQPGNPAPLDQAFTYALPWMSTDAEHASDPAEVPPTDCPELQIHDWNVPLNPTLQTGLDFQPDKQADLSFTLLPYAKTGATLSARLLLVPASSQGFDGATTLAQAPDQAIALEPNVPFAAKLALDIAPEADYVAYASDQNVWLNLRLAVDQPDVVCSGVKTSHVLVTKDFKLALPLDEYHDRLAGIAEAATQIEIAPEGPVEKSARPGSVVTYAFRVTNGGGLPEDVLLSLAGNDAGAAVIVPEGPLRLGSKVAERVTIGVEVPPGASAGSQLEVLLFAHAKSDPSQSAIGRTLTTVALGADAAPDERQALQAAREAGKDTPGPGVVAALVALAVVGAMRRRA